MGDYKDLKADWDTSTKFIEVFNALSEIHGAFICSTWNYEIIDDKRRYERNKTPEIPVEYDYYGQSISVSSNYFNYNPVHSADGSNVQDLFIENSDTVNILVPIRYQPDEEILSSAYKEFMYFNNVEVDNIYREEMGEPLNRKTADDFYVNIIYVPNDTQYLVLDPEIKKTYISDCIAIVINPQNYHRAQLNSMSTQGFYVFAEDPATVESQVLQVFRERGLADGFHSVSSVYEHYRAYIKDRNTGYAVVFGLTAAAFGAAAFLITAVRRKKRR